MKKEYVFLRPLLQLCVGCVCADISYAFWKEELIAQLPCCMVFALFGLVVYAVNSLLTRRERSLSVLLGTNAGLYVLFIVFAVTHGGLAGKGAFIFLFAVSAFPFLYAFDHRETRIGPQTMLLWMDISAVLLLIIAALVPLYDATPVLYIPAVMCFLSAAAGTALSRRGSSSRGTVPAVLLIFAAGVISWILLSRSTAFIGAGFVAFSKAVGAALLFLGKVISRFLIWLVSLFPTPEGDDFLMEPPTGGNMQQGVSTEEFAFPSAVLWIGLGILLAVLILLLWKIRHIRVSANVKSTGGTPKNRTRFIPALCRKIRLRFFLWRNRRSPYALFYCIENRLRRTARRRMPGETPRNFLQRLAASAEDPDCAKALYALIPSVENAFYGYEKAKAFPEYRTILKKL